MRVLHVTTFLQGGAGRVTTALAIAQRRAGHDVTVVADAGGAADYGTYGEYTMALEAAGVPFYTVTSTFKRDLFLNVQAVKEMCGLVDPHCIDVAHTHSAIPALVCRLAFSTARRSIPVVHTMHGWGINKTPEQACTDVMLMNMTDVVVTPSHAARQTLRRLGVRDAILRVIPYGIEDASRGAVDSGDSDRLSRIRMSGTRIALCIGTLGARKRQHLLVEALAEPGLEHLHAVLIGEGDAVPLIERARTLKVRDRLHVLGYRANASRYLAWADVLVLPSCNEGLPLAILEGLQSGTPLVGSHIPEIAEAVEDGRTGFLFRDASPSALASCVRRVLTMSAGGAKQMRERARARFDASYSMACMLATYERLYAGVLGQPAAAHDRENVVSHSDRPAGTAKVRPSTPNPARDAHEWIELARAAIARDRLEAADRHLRRAIEGDPGNREALEALEALARDRAVAGVWRCRTASWCEVDSTSSLWSALYGAAPQGVKQYRVKFDDGTELCVDQTRERTYEDVRGPTELAKYRRASAIVQPGWRVLDAACGTGYGTAFLTSIGCDVWGVDLDPRPITFARHRYPESRFAVGDVRALPFKTGFFDAVVSVETIEHLAEGERVVAEVQRVLAPGGTWLVTTPVRGNCGSPYHVREYQREEFVALLSAAFPDRSRWRWFRDDIWMELAVTR